MGEPRSKRGPSLALPAGNTSKQSGNVMFSSVRVIMSRRMRWVGYAACIGEKRNVYKI
jgi:hypothetical protein